MNDKVFFNNLAKQGITEALYQAFQIKQQNACMVCEKTQARRLTPCKNSKGDLIGLTCTACTILLKTPLPTIAKIHSILDN